METAEEKAALQCILDAPKIRHVGKELRQRGMTDDELREFIAFACQGATVKLAVMNRSQRENAGGLCVTIARVCQNERSGVRVRGNPKLAAALLLVAKHFATLAREANPADAPYLVANSTKHDQDRVYVRLLVDKLRRLLGERLGHGRLTRTVATLASAAVGREITHQQVRDWGAE
jgi:hypothetical protein